MPFNQSVISPQCAAQSIGAANNLFVNVIQALLAAQCSISPPDLWPKNYGPTAVEQGLQEYDFIVIGAGSAGCVVANRLSENPDWKVLLLEAGGDPPIESEIPSFISTMFGSRVDWKFVVHAKQACKANRNGRCSGVRGKMLGGSSAINGMIYVRGNKADYNHWSALGNDGWDFENVLPYFKKSEGNQVPSFVSYEHGKFHNGSGPLKIDFFGEGDDKAESYRQIFLTAANQAGIPIIEDINADQGFGYLKMQSIYLNGRRQSAAKVFLVPVKNRPNLHIITNAFVEKILINSKNEAYGVEFVYDKTHRFRAKARKEVILSAGVYMSPVLLMLSGIGPEEVLNEFKIPVKSNVPVGKNLIDHLATYIWFKFNPTDDAPTQKFDNIYNLAIHNTGPLTSRQVSTINGFINPLNNNTYPEFQIVFFYYKRNSSSFSNYKNGISDALAKENQNHDLVSILVSELHPKSRGTVKIASTSPYDKPIIDGNYYSNGYDFNATIQAIKQQISFTETPSYRQNGGHFLHIPIDECDRFGFRTDDYFRCYIKYFGGGNNHPVGTSRMGLRSDPNTVVDPQLRVKNIKSLMQIDAGIFPASTSGNTNAPTMMTAEKASDIIKKYYKTA